MSRRSDPLWRDQAARDLVLKELRAVAPGSALLLLERGWEIADALGASGASVVHWDRRLGGAPDSLVTPWPPEGRFDWVGLRLPKAREELVMMAHVARARLSAEGRLWVYGANDEGAGSVAGRLADLFEDAYVLAVGKRCRIVEAVGGREGAAKGRIEDWRAGFGTREGFPFDGWASYPGCFAHGRLDAGTALLLEHLPEVTAEAGARVLDFGCGTGVLAAAIRAACPEVGLVLLDSDALSLRAAACNLPHARTVLSDGFFGLDPAERFHLMVANPPYHTAGKPGTSRVLDQLCERAAGFLVPGGRLRLVVQRTHALGPAIERTFNAVQVIAESGGFRVWDAALGR